VANVRFIPLQPREVLPEVLSSADVFLVSQQENVVETVLPSKLMTYMAAGRPVVAAVHPESETAKCIREAECGLIVSPEDPDHLANGIRRMRGDPQFAGMLGRNGRRFAERSFSKETILGEYGILFQGMQPPAETEI
jgi:colanic acid biosynthesis glycosyl transferase WcaI